jgi:hypothetical protein
LASPIMYQPTEALVSVAEKSLRAPMSVTESFLEGLDDYPSYVAPEVLHAGSVSVDREVEPAPF